MSQEYFSHIIKFVDLFSASRSASKATIRSCLEEQVAEKIHGRLPDSPIVIDNARFNSGEQQR